MTLKKSQYVLFFDDRQYEGVAGFASEWISMTGDAWHKKRSRTEVRSLEVLGAPHHDSNMG
jgi:hypothetical protein